MPDVLPQQALSKQAASFDYPHPFPLRNGSALPGFTLAYETYGTLSPRRDNAVLVFHALTGSQNAAGFTESVQGVGTRWTRECQTGWWDAFIGPGKPVDTEKLFVVCANYIGGCYGSSGPSSTNPVTGKPFGASFPRITMPDIVDSQVLLLDHLGIDRLHATIGASIGGMLVLDLATRHPERTRTVVPIASGLHTSVLQRLLNFEQILAIESDANFVGGDYYLRPPDKHPSHGLALARMISHKTFIHLDTLERRARTDIHPPDPESAVSWYPLSLPIESYMLYQGEKFARRFDANTYLRIVDAWQHFDLLQAAGKPDLRELFAPCRHQDYLIFSIDSDVCFYPDAQAELKAALDDAGVSADHATVHSLKGHDSFLLEPDLYTPALSSKLAVP
ncbi:homoserine O-acetyltransferase [soil metagenome]